MVVCVLGCRPDSDALARRLDVAREAYFARGASLVVACGGRAWGRPGVVEADAMARRLAESGVPRAAIVRERCSLDTRDNARFTAALLSRRGQGEVLVVTCAWHLPRAERLFRATGLVVEGLGVPRLETTLLMATYLRVRERVSSWKDAGRGMRLP